MTLELNQGSTLLATLGWKSMAVDRSRPESDLVHRAQAGDVAAFEELYRANVGRIHALCLRMVGDRGRAEELTQDVFVRAWEKLGSFRGRSAFSSWLHRLAVNVVTSRWRSRQRRESRFVSTDAPDDFEGRSRRRDVGVAVDLDKAIEALPQQARMVFVLFDIEGYKHREIARITGLSEGTSKAHLHRARRLLREALGR
jgi:RNA polymerase sigma-70 factor (ECF subfamily)